MRFGYLRVYCIYIIIRLSNFGSDLAQAVCGGEQAVLLMVEHHNSLPAEQTTQVQLEGILTRRMDAILWLSKLSS